MIPTILKKLGDFLLPKAGKIFKGHVTNIGVATVAAGMAYAGLKSGNVFESIRVLVDVAERGVALLLEAKPHAVVIIGAITTLAGWFRKAGHRLGKDQSAGNL